MQRMQRPMPALFNAHQDPLAAHAGPRPRRRPDPQAVAQDYLPYMPDDYQARRRLARRRWADLCPAYAFALTTHAADWPRSGDDAIEHALAAHWEQVRDGSRMNWPQARRVVEDAWMALDHMPVTGQRPLLQ